MTLTAPAVVEPAHAAPPPPARRLSAVAFGLVGVGVVVALAAVHLTQGTSSIGVGDLLGVLGERHGQAWDVLLGARIPRLVAGLLVGTALGVAGAALQSVARNPLASPDLLAVNDGAFLALTASAVFGLSLPLWSSAGVAFAGGLLAAGFVLVISAGGAGSPVRLVLAGSATKLALYSATILLMLLFKEGSTGLFAWSQGSLTQLDLAASRQMLPLLVVGVLGLVAIGRRLDILALGDDTAAVLGLDVRRTRFVAVTLAVFLSAVAVTIAGPVGFVGLAAPTIVRFAGRRIPSVLRLRALLVLSGLTGIIVVLGADVGLRAALGGDAGVEVPTGIVTMLFGSVLMVALASRYRDNGVTREPPRATGPAGRSGGRVVLVLAVTGVAVVAAAIAGTLLGDTDLLLGDVLNWLQGTAGVRVRYSLDERMPRVVAALAAGAALGVSGTLVQGVCRNPLAEPGILGISGGAGIGAISVITYAPSAGLPAIMAAAALGATLAFVAVYGLARRGGLSSDRLVLIGIGLAAGLNAAMVMIIIESDPWNTPKALTWLSGSTYGRQFPQVMPVLVALAVIVPVAFAGRRLLDLLALDDDTPRVLGVRLERARLGLLAGAVALATASVAAVGVVGFVGLVAPHAARALVGGRSARVLPTAALLGALLVSVADTLGRSIIAPAQIPAGLVTAMVGTPYFIWLLWRSRA